jgi:phage tail-like protein
MDAMASQDVTDDIYGNFHFLLEIEGVTEDEKSLVGGFSSVSGGGVKIEKRDITHGNDARREFTAGPVEYENIVLSRGVTRNTDLIDWINDVVAGKVERRSGSIILLDNEGTEVRRWNFFGAFPVSWSGPELSADGSALAIEKFELAVSRTEWK